MTAHPVLLQKKYARIIECFAKKKHISLDEALDCFYKSNLYPLIHAGVSDLHCMSDQYLADELVDEYLKKAPNKPTQQANPTTQLMKNFK